MEITRISALRVDLPLADGAYKWSSGNTVTVDSTLVRLDADAGVTGHGEVVE